MPAHMLCLSLMSHRTAFFSMAQVHVTIRSPFLPSVLNKLSCQDATSHPPFLTYRWHTSQSADHSLCVATPHLPLQPPGRKFHYHLDDSTEPEPCQSPTPNCCRLRPT